MLHNVADEAFVIRKMSFQIQQLFASRSGEMHFTAAAVSEELATRIRELTYTSTEPSVKGRLRDLARHIGMSTSRIEKYWYGLVPTPPAHEADAIRAYYEQAQILIEARKAYDENRRSFLRIYPSLARLAPSSLSDTDLSNEARCAVEAELAPNRPR
jgi:hypothetical protein